MNLLSNIKKKYIDREMNIKYYTIVRIYYEFGSFSLFCSPRQSLSQVENSLLACFADDPLFGQTTQVGVLFKTFIINVVIPTVSPINLHFTYIPN